MKYITKRIIMIFVSVAVLCLCLVGCNDKQDNTPTQKLSVSTNYALILDEITVNNFSDSTTVTDGNGQNVELSAEGKFIAKSVGTYIVQDGSQQFTVSVFGKNPVCEFDYTQSFDGITLLAGDTVVLPHCVVKSVVANYPKYTCQAFRNGTLLQEYSASTANKLFLEQSGNYSLVYKVTDVFGVEHTDEVGFEVIDQKHIVYSVAIPQQILLGEQLTVNSFGYTAQQRYPATLSVTTPSGKEYGGNTVDFNEYGQYALHFGSDIDGTFVEENFVVNTVLNANSLFTNQSGITSVKTDAVLDEYCLQNEKSIAGEPCVEIGATTGGASFYYSGIINLNGKTKNDWLVEFFANKTVGSVDKVEIELIDVYDPSTTLSVYWWQNPWNAGMSYAFVKAYNQAYIGKSYGGGGIWSSDFGTETGVNYTAKTKSSPFAFSFDWKSQSVYIQNGRSVLDLKDKANLPDSFVWNGFTTGEVYMRINFLECVNGSIKIYSVEGNKIGNINYDNLKDEEFICVDTDYKQLPNAVVGQPYPVPKTVQNKVCPNAIAINLSFGGQDVSNLLQGNSFVPTQVGKYTITYSAFDTYGKYVEKSYDVTAVASKTPIAINGEFADTVKVASYYSVPQYTVSGGHGNIVSDCKVILDGKQLVADNYGYYIQGGENLEVIVTATDYLNNVEIKRVQVQIDKDVQTFAFNSIPDYVFAGQNLLFNVSAYNYLTERQMTCGIYVNSKRVDDNFVVPSDVDLLKIYFRAMDTLPSGQVINAQSSTYTVNVIRKQLTTPSDYLVTNVAEPQTLMLSSGLVYKLGPQANTYNFSVPYVMSANDFALKFGFNDGKCGASLLTITLQDVQDTNKTVVIKMSTLTGSTSKVKVNNDIAEYSTSATSSKYRSTCGNDKNAAIYKDTGYKTFAISLDALNGSITDSAGIQIAPIKTWRNGTPFDGFTSGAIKVSFSLDCTAGTTEFIIASLCNQSFSYNLHKDDGINDTTPPVIAQTKPFVTAGAISTTYTLPAIKAYDVFSTTSTVYVNIKNPDGTTLVTNQPLGNGYSFELAQYGQYAVEIIATDGNNSTSKMFMLKVPYDKDPVFSVDGAIQQTAKSGETITLPSYSLQPNSAAQTTVQIIVHSPDGQMKVVNGLSYTFTEVGTYSIVYRAVDEYYNITRYVFDVKVN